MPRRRKPEIEAKGQWGDWDSRSIDYSLIPQKLLDRASTRKLAAQNAKQTSETRDSRNEVVRMLIRQQYSFDWIAERVGLSRRSIGRIAAEMEGIFTAEQG